MSDQSISARLVSFGETVRLARKHRGVTQEQLAEALQSTQETISRIENGRRTPTLRYALRMAKALDVSLGLLLIDAEAALRDQQTERGAA